MVVETGNQKASRHKSYLPKSDLLMKFVQHWTTKVTGVEIIS